MREQEGDARSVGGHPLGQWQTSQGGPGLVRYQQRADRDGQTQKVQGTERCVTAHLAVGTLELAEIQGVGALVGKWWALEKGTFVP